MMRGALGRWVGVAVCLAPAGANAGQECTTTADCESVAAGAYCIEQQCQQPEDVVSLGHRGMFGTGRGYVTMIVVADVCAALTEPFLMLGAWNNFANAVTYFGVLAFVPVTLTGTIVHAVHGRWLPAIVSFFAWSSAVGTTFAIAGEAGVGAGPVVGESNGTVSWATGLAVGALAAGSLTVLDAWMARPNAHAEKASLPFAPTVGSVRGGAVAGIAGPW